MYQIKKYIHPSQIYHAMRNRKSVEQLELVQKYLYGLFSEIYCPKRKELIEIDTNTIKSYYINFCDNKSIIYLEVQSINHNKHISIPLTVVNTSLL